ncbi:MAG: 50S ribosomal protein L19e [Nanoarchaeota archaeon]|nr:50S ribosomal protein L19e [Nanoarchaeota archaeon]MBU0962695.1 50S ribosomal protein L19e [Nanoarchaeota archaeon]
MNTKMQKNLALRMLGIGKRRIKINPDHFEEVKEAITRSDIKSLIKNGSIVKLPARGISRSRARHIMNQKRKGRKSGKGSLKGKRTARLSRKTEWINKVRSQRDYLKDLKKKSLLSTINYRILRKKIKGGFFRSVRHVRLFIDEYNLIKKDGN